MAFELIYSLKEKKYWWTEILFYFALALLLGSLVFYLLMQIRISSLNHKILTIQDKLKEVGTPEQKEIEKKVFAYQTKITLISGLLKEHKIPTRLFDFFEKNTLPEIQFVDFKEDVLNNAVLISGNAPDLDILSKQLKIFEDSSQVIDVFESHSSKESEGVDFKIRLLLSPELFLWK